MNDKRIWGFGIVIGSIILFVLSFPQVFLSNTGYSMMAYRHGWYMPIMHGNPGMMGFGMMFIIWLILLGLLILIGLGIVWLIKTLTATK